MANPAEFFVGITDFFSILLPGAVMTFVLLCIEKTQCANIFDKLPLGREGRYAVFFVAAYLVGHVIDMIGASVIDHIYDLTYAHWKRNDAMSLLQWLQGTPARLTIEAQHWFQSVFSPPEETMFSSREAPVRLENDLLRAARKLGERERPPGINVYKWSRSWTMLESNSASTEIERLQANSKFFRGMVTVSAITAICLFLIPIQCAQYYRYAPYLKLAGWACLILALACFLRYGDLRWKAVEQTYAFYIALRWLREAPDKAKTPGQR